MDLNTDLSGSKVQVICTSFSEEEKEEGCPNILWGGWTNLKLLRTGTDGKAAQTSRPFLGCKDSVSLRHLDSSGFWLRDLLRLRIVLGTLSPWHGEPLIIPSNNGDQY